MQALQRPVYGWCGERIERRYPLIARHDENMGSRYNSTAYFVLYPIFPAAAVSLGSEVAPSLPNFGLCREVLLAGLSIAMVAMQIKHIALL